MAPEMNFELKHEPLVAIESHVCIARTPRAQALEMLQDASIDPDMANRYMRLFYLFQGTQQDDFSLQMQAKALSLRRTYRLQTHAHPGERALRLLALCAPGDMRENLPLDYLVENQPIQLELLYLLPGEPAPTQIPEHDVAIVAIGHSKSNAPILEALCEWAAHWPRPMLNTPTWISFCERERAYQTLRDIPGLLMAQQERHTRARLLAMAHSWEVQSDKPLPLPFTLRPSELHAGIGFELITRPEEFLHYLNEHHEEDFYACPYLPYQSDDQQYRKFRLCLIQGRPFVSHLAISAHWVVHYKSAQMEFNEDKKREEQRFMEDFEDLIAKPFASIFEAIYRLIPLDYLVLDCALSAKGGLIVFEIDNSAWVHDTDAEELFPYKKAIMKKTFDAFYQMLINSKP
jgi:hypothetical protein